MKVLPIVAWSGWALVPVSLVVAELAWPHPPDVPGAAPAQEECRESILLMSTAINASHSCPPGTMLEMFPQADDDFTRVVCRCPRPFPMRDAGAQDVSASDAR